MKYNDEAFNISAQHYQNIKKIEVDNIDTKLQDKLLKILLKRFSEELKKNPNQNNGIVKVRFKSPFWQDPEEGYNLIKELVESQKFDTFASEYCFYLGDIETRCDEYYTSYFEIIWDYKSYFESLSMSVIESEISDTNSNKNELISALKNFKGLPLKYQLLVLKSFLEKVSECEKDFSYEEAVKICNSEGHQFSKWEKTTHVNSEGASSDYQLISDCKIGNVVWKRTCERCGYMENVEQKPQEVIDGEKQKRKQAEIKKLELRLKKLKEDN